VRERERKAGEDKRKKRRKKERKNAFV